MPIPLKDRFQSRNSDIWNRDISWQGTEHLFVRAPSGTGKTTLVHQLYGLRQDFEGSIHWGADAIQGMQAEQLSTLRQGAISIIFQDLRLFPVLTAWENLEIKRTLTDTISIEETRSMMDVLGIADRADRPAATLSYGEQQRVAIIRALLQPFSWLLMDEPFSHLDIENRAIAAQLIQNVVTRNKASFMLVDLDDNDLFPYSQKLRL
jgi:putative ABC transport system ATP-binding protein